MGDIARRYVAPFELLARSPSPFSGASRPEFVASFIINIKTQLVTVGNGFVDVEAVNGVVKLKFLAGRVPAELRELDVRFVQEGGDGGRRTLCIPALSAETARIGFWLCGGEDEKRTHVVCLALCDASDVDEQTGLMSAFIHTLGERALRDACCEWVAAGGLVDADAYSYWLMAVRYLAVRMLSHSTRWTMVRARVGLQNELAVEISGSGKGGGEMVELWDFALRCDRHVCAHCGTRGRAKVCTQCRSVRYCGRECQKKHWASHKAVCCRAGLP